MLKGRKHSIMLLVETPRNASNESRAEVVQASGPGRSSQEETPEKDPQRKTLVTYYFNKCILARWILFLF